MSRIFDHKKQYACMEVFRLEELQECLSELEELCEPDEERFHTAVERLFALSGEVKDATKTIKAFIANLEEQERPNYRTTLPPVLGMRG